MYMTHVNVHVMCKCCMIYIHTYTHTYRHTYVYAYTHTCKYIFIHTHTRVHRYKNKGEESIVFLLSTPSSEQQQQEELAPSLYLVQLPTRGLPYTQVPVTQGVDVGEHVHASDGGDDLLKVWSGWVGGGVGRWVCMTTTRTTTTTRRTRKTNTLTCDASVP